MRLCHIVPSLEERHGGPSKSVYALGRTLARLGHETTLLATRRGEPATRYDDGLRVNLFARDRPRRFCASAGLRDYLKSSASDIVHHHSLWLRTLHYAHQHAERQGVPLVIAPRGMMSAWAWLHHSWRKRAARRLVHPGALSAVAGWHATSAAEAADIRARGYPQPICLAPNGVIAPTVAERAAAAAYWREACPATTLHPTALFYGRLHRKKRVLELIDLWLEQAPASWLLLIVGLSDEYTAAQLETYVMRASGAGRVKVFDGLGRPPPYPVASIFLLPSHDESFGLAIAEAMAHGVPPLVTDSTPWSQLTADDSGWCVPWADYPATLRAALAEDENTLQARGARARARALADYSWERSALILEAFYNQLRGGAGTAAPAKPIS
jgi:glycosyltransferase involved in cell wall biosynthesis